MEPSHWWQRWSTPIQSKNPFKPDFEDLSQLFGPIEESSTAAKTPRARSANPFRSDEVCSTPAKSKELLAAQTTPSLANTFRAAVTPPLVRSSNPFRSNDGLPSFYIPSQESTAADRKIKQPVKLPEDFDGKQPLKEYLMHFERCAIVNGWNEEEKAMFLTASLRGDSRKLLSGLTELECKQYSKIVARLQLRFGVEKQAELHQSRLLNRRQFEGESLPMLATDIRSMVDLAYQDLGAPVQERFAVQHFIDALYDKDDRLYLRREKPETLDQALSLARELESLRVLDNNNSFRRAGTKVRAMETERMQLQIQVDELKRQIDYQQQQLEAQETIISRLNQFVTQQEQPHPNRNRAAQGTHSRGRLECWNCGDRGHMRKECPKLKATPNSSQPSGNENRVSSRAQRDA